MEQVLGWGTSKIVTTHHREHSKIEVKLFVETNNCLDEVPDKAREVVEERTSYFVKAWDIKDTVNVADKKVRDLKELKGSQ